MQLALPVKGFLASDYPEVRQRSFAALRMTARGCHPERSEGSVVRIRPADPTHVALGTSG